MSIRVKLICVILLGAMLLSMTGCTRIVSTHISAEQYQQIKAGMTYDEVTSLIGGPGQVVAEGAEGDMTVKFYGDVYGADITFEDNVVTKKAQNNWSILAGLSAGLSTW